MNSDTKRLYYPPNWPRNMKKVWDRIPLDHRPEQTNKTTQNQTVPSYSRETTTEGHTYNKTHTMNLYEYPKFRQETQSNTDTVLALERAFKQQKQTDTNENSKHTTHAKEQQRRSVEEHTNDHQQQTNPYHNNTKRQTANRRISDRNSITKS